VGPSFKGIYNRQGKLADGKEYTADATYIKQAILNPTSQVVEGYPPAMPSFEGKFSDEQLNDLIEWMKTL
jgi:cytochrome c oxidase subunit 2